MHTRSCVVLARFAVFRGNRTLECLLIFDSWLKSFDVHFVLVCVAFVDHKQSKHRTRVRTESSKSEVLWRHVKPRSV